MSQTATRKTTRGEDEPDPTGGGGPGPAPPRFGEAFTAHMFLAEYSRGRGWHAGRIAPFGPLPLSPAAAGLHYGQLVFEGLKAVRGVDDRIRIFRLDRHCQRMARSAARLCMPPVPEPVLREALCALVRRERDQVPRAPGTALYLRPLLLAVEPFLGVRPANEYLLAVIASPMAGYYGGGLTPLRIRVEDRHVRAPRGGLGAAKAAANYAASLQAAERARRAGYAQVLWTDAGGDGALQEVGTMNVFLHVGDEVITPPLDGTILAGVTRDSVLCLLRRWGQAVRERRITMDEVLEARRTGRLREMFGAGTAAGIAPVGELGWRSHRIPVGDGRPGPLARRLLPTLAEIQTGAVADADGWTTVVC